MMYFAIKKLKREFKLAFNKLVKISESDESRISQIIKENLYFIEAEYRALKFFFDECDGLTCDTDGVRIYTLASSYIKNHGEISKTAISDKLKSLQKDYGLVSSEVYGFCDILKIALIIGLSSDEKSLQNVEYHITGLHYLGKLNTTKLCDNASYLNSLLSQDKYYCQMTPECKMRYRILLCKKAKNKGVSEAVLATELIEKCKNATSEREKHIGYYLMDKQSNITTFCYYGITAIFTVLFVMLFYSLCSWWCILTFFSALELGYRFSEILFSKICKDKFLPCLEIESIPDDSRTVTVITALINKDSTSVFDSLENYYLSNKDKNAYFGIVADLCQSNEMYSPSDSVITEYAKGRIDCLNSKYGGGFFALFRDRVYSNTEKRYMGWERKRGAIVSLCSVLRGKQAEGVYFYGDENSQKNIKYCITLDEDTVVAGGDVKKLLGYMMHPQNKPIVDEKRHIVTSGYGIMQPAIDTALPCAEKTAFSKMLSLGGGFDLYQSCGYDTAQKIFSEGIFCGKGIFDIDAFEKTVSNAFPDGVVLSHDILEGARLRTASLNDVRFFDSVPKSTSSYFKRAHRWCRGDIQALCFAGSKVSDSNGKKIKNPISTLSKIRIVSNSVRDLLPAISVATIVISLFLQRKAASFTVIGALSYIIIPIAVQIVKTLFSGKIKTLYYKTYRGRDSYLMQSIKLFLFEICSMFKSAQNSVDAAIRGIYRQNISHRKTLEWTTAAEGDKTKSSFLGCIIDGLASAMAGTAIFLVSNSYIAAVISLTWLAYPFFSYYSSKPVKIKKQNIDNSQKEDFKKSAYDMWNYYAHFVNAQTNFLPPDNVQEEPEYKVAMRTSPTNIGFYLISVVCARDLKFISSKTMYLCIKNTLSSIEKLPKWNGHLYNWYDISSLSVLGKKYVSTVDSGNFTALLMTVREGIIEYADECPEITDLAYKIYTMCVSTDFSLLYNKDRNLLYLGYDGELNLYDDICYDLLMSEARLTGYYAVAMGQIPYKHWKSMSRRIMKYKNKIGLASWTGTAFEYFMPELLMNTVEGSAIKDSLCYCFNVQKTKTAQGMFGCSESGYYSFDSDMNYGYRAFGVSALALKSDMDFDTVLSPYSSYLFSDICPKSSHDNLALMERKGMYGKYGFYEAADFTESRVGHGIGYVKSYMAHHVGMSICAVCNIICEEKLKKRFMNIPQMRSAQTLLWEKIPDTASVYKSKYKDAQIEFQKTNYVDSVTSSAGYCPRYTAHIGNNKCGVIADNFGKVQMFSGSFCVNIADFEAVDIPRMLRVYKVDKNGRRSLFDLSECVMENCSGYIKYKSDYGELVFTIANNSFVIFVCFNDDTYKAAICFEPLLQRYDEFASHPAYSGIMCESSFDSDNNLIVIKRNLGKGAARYLSVCASDEISFCTMKRNALPAGYGESDIRNIKTDNLFGPCISPIVFAETFCDENGKAVFSICADNDKEISSNSAISALKSDINIAIKFLTKNNANALTISGMTELDRKKSERVLSAMTLKEENTNGGYREELWKFGISGDLPVITDVYDGINKENVLSLFRIYKYFLIRHLRFNPVIIYTEKSGYYSTREELIKLAEMYGIDRLVGTKYGLYFVEDKDAEPVISMTSANLLYKASEIRNNKRTVIMCGEEVEYPRFDYLFDVYGGKFTNDGFVADKLNKRAPFAYILASKCFGSVVTDNSIGYSYLFNSQLGLITNKDSDLLRSLHGERVLFCENGICYDLASCSNKVYFGRGKAIYYGKIPSGKYEIELGVGEKEFAKSIKISTHGMCGKLILEITPFGKNEIYLQNDCIFYCGGCDNLIGYTEFVKLKNADFSVSENKIRGEISISGEAENIIYICAFKTKEHFKHLYKICDGRSFCADIDRYKSKRVITGYKSLDIYANVFLKYQNLVSRIFARSGYYQCSGAYGFRDQLQDCINAVDYAPDILKTHILRCCAHQFEKGDVLHWWHRTRHGTYGVRTRCSDDRLWLPYAVAEYIAKTGDDGICKLKVPYVVGDSLLENENEKTMYVCKSRISETVYGHCLKALYLSEDAGEHGLPKIGSCDWNDGFNEIGGESVWLAFFIGVVVKKIMPLFDMFCDSSNRMRAKRLATFYLSNARKYAYEYGQYLRAVYNDGEILGSKLSDECKTDILVQSFAVLSDCEEGKRLEAILDTIENMWDEKYEIMPLLTPPFEHNGKHRTGYIRDYPDGVRENGGQYTHAAIWAALALYHGGRCDKAKRIILSMCPSERCKNKEMGKVYYGEPYVVAGDVYNCENSKGECGWSWYTGAAGWMQTAIKKIFDKNIDK